MNLPKIYIIKYLAYFLIIIAIFSIGYKVGYTNSSEKCVISSIELKENHKKQIDKISKGRDNQLKEIIDLKDKSIEIYTNHSNKISKEINKIHKEEIELKERVNNEKSNIDSIDCFDDSSLQLLKEGYGY